MFNTIKYLFFILIVIAFVSCSKEDIKRKIEKTTNKEVTEGDADTTALTPEEAFSLAMVNILDIEDEDLQNYLEDEIYPIVKNSNKITIDNISSSLFLLQYVENGIQKNILIQKFYDVEKDEYFFEKREVQNDAIKQFVK